MKKNEHEVWPRDGSGPHIQVFDPKRLAVLVAIVAALLLAVVLFAPSS